MHELSGLDTRFLYSETPTAHMHTMKVAIVDVGSRDTTLTPAVFGELLGERLDRLPALRRRPVFVPHRAGPPLWVEDPEFDLTRHVNWRMIPAPGGRRELARIVADIGARQLPRDRPLWGLTVVDGLAGGQLAFVVKIHHALADGVAAAAMLENAFTADDAAVIEPSCPERLPADDELRRLAAASRRRRLQQAPRLALRTANGVCAARRVQRSAGVGLPRMFSAPRTPFNVSLTPERTYAVTDLPMADVLRVKRAAAVTVNDVFLTVCGGALRSYLERRNQLPPADLIAGVPIATHVGEYRLSGNHVDNLVLALGADVADPAERIQVVHRTSLAARAVREALGTDLFERRAAHTPLHLYPLGLRSWAATRLADRVRAPLSIIASNVAGPRTPLDLEGGRVSELWSVGPILEGIGLNITAWSYTDRLFVSALGCPKSLPDPEELTADLERALDVTLAAVCGN